MTSFYTVKEPKMKIQPIEREKIVANNETDKGLISKIYEQLIQQKINTPIKKGQRAQMEKWRHFSKE